MYHELRKRGTSPDCAAVLRPRCRACGGGCLGDAENLYYSRLRSAIVGSAIVGSTIVVSAISNGIRLLKIRRRNHETLVAACRHRGHLRAAAEPRAGPGPGDAHLGIGRR